MSESAVDHSNLATSTGGGGPKEARTKGAPWHRRRWNSTPNRLLRRGSPKHWRATHR
jgi:hypothetical protein